MTDTTSPSPVTESTPRPAAAVVDYDHFSPGNVDSPYSGWIRLRQECPVAWSEAHGGFYLLTNYEDVRSAAVDYRTFSSADGTATPRQPMQLLPEDIDPPEQRAYRKVLNRRLTPAAVSAMEPEVRRIARQLMAAIEGRDEFDYGEAFGLPFPRHVTMFALGFPVDEVPTITPWVEAMAERSDDELTAQAGAAMFGYLQEFITRRRTEAPDETLISAVLNEEVDGRLLDDDEVIRMMVLLLLGGLSTTTGAISGMALWLADHPEDRARLRAEPELMDTAIDEFLRWTSPITHIGRTATADTEVHGCPVSAGDRVMLGFGAANRDPEQFERAEEVVLDRYPNHHLAFGMGPHRCVGSHLARLMLRVALEELLETLDDFSVADRDGIRWIGGEGRAITALPMKVGA